MHLAQLNIGRLRYSASDPRVAGFMENLDRVNALAEAMPGFVWRLKDETNNATKIDASGDFGPGVIVNMSVWKSAEELERFVWQTVHRRFYNKKAEWFHALGDAHFVMWWVEEGHLPGLGEAAERLGMLREHGSTDAAFGWDHLPDVKMWRTQRCA